MCGKKVVGKCGSCTKSQVHKDTERHVAKAKEIGQQENVTLMDETTILETEALPTTVDKWCCMY